MSEEEQKKRYVTPAYVDPEGNRYEYEYESDINVPWLSDEDKERIIRLREEALKEAAERRSEADEETRPGSAGRRSRPRPERHENHPIGMLPDGTMNIVGRYLPDGTYVEVDEAERIRLNEGAQAALERDQKLYAEAKERMRREETGEGTRHKETGGMREALGRRIRKWLTRTNS